MIGVGQLPPNLPEAAVARMSDAPFALRGECLFLLDLLIRKRPAFAARFFDAGALIHCQDLAPAFPDAVLFLAHAIAVVLGRETASRVAEQIRALAILEACEEAAELLPEDAEDVAARACALRAALAEESQL
jgi:hypothetical protein